MDIIMNDVEHIVFVSEEIFFKIWRNFILKNHILSFLKRYQFSNDFKVVKYRHSDYSCRETKIQIDVSSSRDRNAFSRTKSKYPNSYASSNPVHFSMQPPPQTERVIQNILYPPTVTLENKKIDSFKPGIERIRHYYDARMTSEWITSNKHWALLVDKIKNNKQFKCSYNDIYRFLLGNQDFDRFLQVYDSKAHLFEMANYYLLKVTGYTILDLSCYAGNLDIIDFLSRKRIHKFYFSNSAIDMACYHGHYHVVKYLLDTFFNMKCGEQAMDLACQSGNLDLVILLHNTFPMIVCTVRAMNGAATNGHFHIMKWLHSNRKEGCSHRGLIGAINFGDRAQVEFLLDNYRNSFVINSKILDITASKGNVEILKLITSIPSNSKLSSHSISSACFNGDLPMLKFLTTNYPIVLNDFSLFGASAKGHLDVVKYLLQSYETTPRNYYSCITVALSNGHQDIALFLIASEPKILMNHYVCDLIVASAASGGLPKVLEYVESNHKLAQPLIYQRPFEIACFKGDIEMLRTISRYTNRLNLPHSHMFPRKLCLSGNSDILPYIIKQCLSSSIKLEKDLVLDITSPALLKSLYEVTKSYKIHINNSHVKINFSFPNDIYPKEDYIEWINICVEGLIEMDVKSLIYNLMSNSQVEKLHEVLELIDPQLHDRNRYLSPSTEKLLNVLKQIIGRNKCNLKSQVDIFQIIPKEMFRPGFLTLLLKVSLIGPDEINIYTLLGSNIKIIKWWFKFCYKSDPMILDYYIKNVTPINVKVLEVLRKLKDQVIQKDLQQIKCIWNANDLPISALLEVLMIVGIDELYMKYVLSDTSLSRLRQEIFFYQKDKFNLSEEFLSRDVFKGLLSQDTFISHPIQCWESLSRFTIFDSPKVEYRLQNLYPIIKKNIKSRNIRGFDYRSPETPNNNVALLLINAILRFYKHSPILVLGNVNYITLTKDIFLSYSTTSLAVINSIVLSNNTTKDCVKINFGVANNFSDFLNDEFKITNIPFKFKLFGKPQRPLQETLDSLPIIKNEIEAIEKEIIDIQIEHSLTTIEAIFTPNETAFPPEEYYNPYYISPYGGSGYNPIYYNYLN